MSEREARTIIATWMRTYPDAARRQKRQAQRCKSARVVETPAGRIYRFAWEPNGRFNYNLALNLPIVSHLPPICSLRDVTEIRTKHAFPSISTFQSGLGGLEPGVFGRCP